MPPCVIAIMNLKGGTGKTTTTVNLGAGLTKLGKRVLLLDLDPQGSLTYHLGVNRYRHSMAEVMLQEVPLPEVWLQRERMWLAPADFDLANADLSLATYRHRETVLQEALSGLAESGHRFDYVLIDCSPSLSLLNINALTAADYLLIPLQLEVLSLKSLNHMQETVRRMQGDLNPRLQLLGVVPVMVDPRQAVGQEIYTYVKENFEAPFFRAHIQRDEAAIAAPSYGESLLRHAPDSAAAKDYLSLAVEVITSTSKVAERE